MSPPRRLAWAWLGLQPLLGAAASLLSLPGPQREQLITTVLGVATTAFVYIWCRAEAASRGHLPPGRSALWAGLVPPVGLPIYFLRTRAPGRAAWSSAQALAFYLLGVGLFSLAEAGARAWAR